MRWMMTMAALTAAALPLATAAAQTMHGYTVRATRLYSGPLREYPSVRYVGRGANVRMHGCLRDWSWCDVTYRANRGWIAGDALRISHDGRRRGIAAEMGIGVISFSFGNYWDTYYRGREFYGQRNSWQTRYQTRYRPEWGERDEDRHGENRPGDNRPADHRPDHDRPGANPHMYRQQAPMHGQHAMPGHANPQAGNRFTRKAAQIRDHAPARSGEGGNKAHGKPGKPPHD